MATRIASTNHPTRRIPSYEITKARGRAGMAARTLPESHPDRVSAKQELKTLVAAEHLAKVVEEWPPLSQEQLERLTGILRAAPSLDPKSPSDVAAAAARRGKSAA